MPFIPAPETGYKAGAGAARFVYSSLLIPALLLLALLVADRLAGRLVFHSLAELFSVGVGVMLFVVAWHTRSLLRNDFLLFLGIGYLWVALLDGLHLLSMPGLGLFPLRDAEITLHFWIYTRLFEAAILLGAFHFLHHPLVPVRALVGGGAIALLIVLLSVWVDGPPMLTDHGLTVYKTSAELLVMGLLLLVLWRLWSQREALASNLARYLAASVLLTLFSEAAFTLYADFDSPAFLVGHLLKFLSYWMIYRAIVETSLKQPFTMLSRASSSYDAIPHPALVVDSRGAILQANRAAAEMAGCEVEQLGGQPVHEHFHAAELAVEDCELCRAIAEQRPLDGYVLYLPEEDCWYQLSLAPLSAENPSMGMVQTLLDITSQLQVSRDLTETVRKRRRVEEALQASEEKYRLLVQNATEIILVAQGGCIRFVNPKIEQVLGYPEEALLGQPFLQFVHEEDQEMVAQRHAARLRGEAVHDVYHFRVRASNGDIKWLEIKAVRIDWEGQAATLNFLTDITRRIEMEQALRDSEQRFRSLFEHADAVAVQGYDSQRRVIYWNRASEALYGYRREQAMGRPMEDLILPPARRQEMVEAIGEWFEQGQVAASGERVLCDADGASVPVFSSHVLLSKSSGERELYCIDIDLGKVKQIEREIRTLSQAVEQSPVAVMIIDLHRRVEYVNSAFEEITGYTAAEILGHDPTLLESPATPPERYAEIWQTLREGHAWKGELESRRKNGERYWEFAYFAPVVDDSGEIRHFLAVSEDITLRKEQQQRILHQAHFDTLTDLPNRFLSLDRLGHAIREARRSGECVSLLFLDLDDFKKINDSLGHEVGDRVLVEAAARLRSAVRSGDTVGRLGGDEFVVLLGGLSDPGDAMPVVENLMQRLREPYRLDGRELVMSVSIGIASYPLDGDDVSELLRKADSAMYHAKGQGRNAFSFFTEEMNREVSYRLALEEQIHGALDRSEFRVVYQPKVDVATGSVIGAEALLRWRNPKLGEVPPEEFIPAAEQTGVIVPLGQFVLQEALAMTRRQRQRRERFHIAVNLSPRQFRDPNLVGEIAAALKRNELPASALELEITEGVLMSGHAYIDQALEMLTGFGVRIAMDDFGTGYSSLSYLRQYPFDVLKIDRSFVRDIGEDAADRELISAAIAMAHGLGLEVVAEGVETEEQRAFLHSLRCDCAQGYLFGKPGDEDGLG